MSIADQDAIETVDGEPMLAIDNRLGGLPAELPAHLAAERTRAAAAASSPTLDRSAG